MKLFILAILVLFDTFVIAGSTAKIIAPLSEYGLLALYLFFPVLGVLWLFLYILRKYLLIAIVTVQIVAVICYVIGEIRASG